MNGLAFLRTLKYPRQIIFKTAYKEYAVNAFEFAACDYLVKPSAFETMLPSCPGLRVHRSFPINKDKITSTEGSRLFIGEQQIPIG